MALGTVTDRVSDLVRKMVPRFRFRLTTDEQTLGIYLRGNASLLESLTNIINRRIEGRANKPVPNDPNICMAVMTGDKELRWLLGRLEDVYRSPAVTETEDSEQPE